METEEGLGVDDGIGLDSGSAYKFVEPDGGWAGTLNETTKLLPSDGGLNARFGLSVAVSDRTVVIGAHNDFEAPRGADQKGAAYVFDAGLDLSAAGICPGEVATPILDNRPVPVSAEDRAQMVQSEDCGEIVRFVAELPAHVCINELTVSPTWNRGYVAQARQLTS